MYEKAELHRREELINKINKLGSDNGLFIRLHNGALVFLTKHPRIWRINSSNTIISVENFDWNLIEKGICEVEVHDEKYLSVAQKLESLFNECTT